MTEQDISAVTPQVSAEVQKLVDRLKQILGEDNSSLTPNHRNMVDLASLAKEAIDLLVKGEPFNPPPK